MLGAEQGHNLSMKRSAGHTRFFSLAVLDSGRKTAPAPRPL